MTQKRASFIFFIILLGAVAIFYTTWLTYLNKVETSNKPKIESDFFQIYNSFLKEAEIRGVTLDNKYVEMRFGDMNDKESFRTDELAKCLFFPHPQVLVNKEKFLAQPNHVQELTIYHELVHCLWIKPHVYKYPHIMNEYSDPNLYKLYENYRKNMLDDLFNSHVYLKSYYLVDYFNSLSKAFGHHFVYFILLAVSLLLIKDLVIKKTLSSKKDLYD